MLKRCSIAALAAAWLCRVAPAYADPAYNLGLLPTISASATTSQDGDGLLTIAFVTQAKAGATATPIDLTGIAFTLQWHPVSTSGAANTVVTSLSAATYLNNGGTTGVLTFNIPKARLRVLPLGTYVASLVASYNSATADLGLVTITHSALGSSGVGSLTTTARNTATATSVGYVPGPQGLSAFQVAVANGYAGTQAQWLASLVGAPGTTSFNGLTGSATATQMPAFGGDITCAAGTASCSVNKIGGQAPAASATTDTTNASNINKGTLSVPVAATPSNGATSTASLNGVLGQTFDVTQGFGGSTAIDNCAAFKALSSALQTAGGGTIRVAGNLVSSCAITVVNVPVAVEGVGGEGQASITFTTVNNAGIVVNENDGHKRVSVRRLRLYSTVAQTGSGVYAPAVSITFPSGTNAPDASARVEDVQIDYEGAGYFTVGIACANCTHHVFDTLDIQGAGLQSGQTSLSATMQAGIRLSGYSGNGKISHVEITNVINAIEISGDTEGEKIADLNTVSVNWSIMLDDGTSGDTASAADYPGPQIENIHCDAYLGCIDSKGWGQLFVHNFNFYKRGQSTSFWAGINLAAGTYGNISAPSMFNKFAFGRCAVPQGTPGGADCVVLGPTANGNTISDVEPDGVNYFVDEGSTSTNNTITDNKGFPIYSGFYANQTSIYNAWRNNPSPYNYNRRNIPAVIGNADTTYNLFAANSATPNVGGFNLQTFHTANTAATTITNFLNGAQGDTIVVVATDADTTIQNNGNIVTTSGQNIVLSSGSAVRFVLDGTVWRQL